MLTTSMFPRSVKVIKSTEKKLPGLPDLKEGEVKTVVRLEQIGKKQFAVVAHKTGEVLWEKDLFEECVS